VLGNTRTKEGEIPSYWFINPDACITLKTITMITSQNIVDTLVYLGSGTFEIKDGSLEFDKDNFEESVFHTECGKSLTINQFLSLPIEGEMIISSYDDNENRKGQKVLYDAIRQTGELPTKFSISDEWVMANLIIEAPKTEDFEYTLESVSVRLVSIL
jgi:hypothetical protein